MNDSNFHEINTRHRRLAVYSGLLDGLDDGEPIHDLPEHAVFVIERARIARDDEERCRSARWIITASHGEDALHVRRVAELRFERVDILPLFLCQRTSCIEGPGLN